MNNSRVDYVIKNIIWGYLCTAITYIVGFAARTVLVWTLGQNFVGINGLFANILGILSFAELGIGSAFNYSLYKPIAEKDNEKIKSLMYLYKKLYRIIAIIILIIGLILVPFLKYFVNDPGNVGDIRIYYIIFLLNVVSSYFVSYKFSFVNAKQENYVFYSINMITTIFTSVIQIAVLIFENNYLYYLVVGALADLLQKIVVSLYLNQRYELLKCKNVFPLNEYEIKKIWRDAKALLFHKIGDICVHQTDNIIISAFVNIATVGKVSYYMYFVDSAHQILVVALNAVIGSIGNLISTEQEKRQYEIFKVYRFTAFWLYGYLSIGLYLMLSKFVMIVVGANMLLPNIVVFLMVLNFYLLGQRCVLNNMKMAGGIFRQDQYLAIIQAVVNLVTSILFVQIIGLPGVYIGTILQGTISTIIKPIIVYHIMFHQSAFRYFEYGFRYLISVLFVGFVCFVIDKTFFLNSSLLFFVLEVFVLSIVINISFIAFFWRTREFQYLWGIFLNKIVKKK